MTALHNVRREADAIFKRSGVYFLVTSSILPVQGSRTTSYLFLGDRWAQHWGGKHNDSTYVWLPLRFPSNTSLTMAWHPKVTINADTGVVWGTS